MNSQELRDMIFSDEIAMDLVSRGDDQGCANRLIQIAPLVRKQTVLTERGLYDRLGPDVAESVLQRFEAYQGDFSSNVKRVLLWLRPAEGGVDFGDPSLIGLLQALYSVGIGITQEELDAMLAMSLYRQEITASQVSTAWSIYRPDGKVVQ